MMARGQLTSWQLQVRQTLGWHIDSADDDTDKDGGDDDYHLKPWFKMCTYARAAILIWAKGGLWVTNREQKDTVQQLFEIMACLGMLKWPMCVKLKA